MCKIGAVSGLSVSCLWLWICTWLWCIFFVVKAKCAQSCMNFKIIFYYFLFKNLSQATEGRLFRCFVVLFFIYFIFLFLFSFFLFFFFLLYKVLQNEWMRKCCRHCNVARMLLAMFVDVCCNCNGIHKEFWTNKAASLLFN